MEQTAAKDGAAYGEVVFWKWEMGSDILPQTSKAVLYTPQRKEQKKTQSEIRPAETQEETQNEAKGSHEKGSETRDKLLNNGEEALSKAELLAVLLGSGAPDSEVVDMCAEILATYGDSLDQLVRTPTRILSKEKGIGAEKACIISAAMELARRRVEETHTDIPNLKSSVSVAKMFGFLGEREKEEVWIVFANSKMQVSGKKMLTLGTTNNSFFVIKDILKEVLVSGCENFCMVHNHPNHTPNPSAVDLDMTKRLKKAAELIGVNLLDHIIIYGIGEEDFYSMRDGGKLK